MALLELDTEEIGVALLEHAIDDDSGGGGIEFLGLGGVVVGFGFASFGVIGDYKDFGCGGAVGIEKANEGGSSFSVGGDADCQATFLFGWGDGEAGMVSPDFGWPSIEFPDGLDLDGFSSSAAGRKKGVELGWFGLDQGVRKKKAEGQDGAEHQANSSLMRRPLSTSWTGRPTGE